MSLLRFSGRRGDILSVLELLDSPLDPKLFALNSFGISRYEYIKRCKCVGYCRITLLTSLVVMQDNMTYTWFGSTCNRINILCSSNSNMNLSLKQSMILQGTVNDSTMAFNICVYHRHNTTSAYSLYSYISVLLWTKNLATTKSSGVG